MTAGIAALRISADPRDHAGGVPGTRLSRARSEIVRFTQAKCGLQSPTSIRDERIGRINATSGHLRWGRYASGPSGAFPSAPGDA